MARPSLLLLAALATLACTAANPDYHPEAPADARPTDAPKADRPVVDEAPGFDDTPVPLPPDAPGDALDTGADLGSPDLGAPDGPAALGLPCTSGAACASGTCVHGVCCNSDCRERCWSCTLPSSLGTCALVPADDDPHDDCPAEEPSTCGRSGACDGAGACTLHGAGTDCRPQTCVGGVETAANLCDGAGHCTAGATRACPLTECTGDACAVECSPSIACPLGSQCVSGRCSGDGPLLYWRFDEPSGAAAQDASGNNFQGNYLGEPTVPQPSTNVPITMFANPRSRTFAPSGRPGVYLAALDTRPLTSNLSVTLWFRATTATITGSDVFSINVDVMLRIRLSEIEFDKRKSTVTGSIFAIALVHDVKGHLDGHWHHLAGVASPGGMDVYLDGVLRYHDVDGLPIIFRSPASVWVGREGASVSHDFAGDLDDVRIYARALSAAEVAALARGVP